MDATKKYEEFHGKPYRKVDSLDFHIPKRLVFLGRAVAIEYECDKLHGGGDGKRAVYRHEFETPARVCMDERGRGQLYIIGSRIMVDRDGIKK